jgi:hypothetical protein
MADATRTEREERHGGLVGKIRERLTRDRELSLGEKLGKGARWVLASLTAPFRLSACDVVGARARTRRA